MNGKTPLITPIILAGGKGTRLWPMSRAERPKQFLQLTGDQSLLQQTLLRASGPRYAKPIVITNEDYRFLVAEQALECGVELGGILLEPEARNTAPAIAAAAVFGRDNQGAEAILVLPSDHAIETDKVYDEAIALAIDEAAAGHLVTFGVTPFEPATGYGYIETGDKRESGAFGVARFTEKPDMDTARQMLAAGNYLWNSGMFMFGISGFLHEMDAHAPDVRQAAEAAVAAATRDFDFVRLDRNAFAKAPNISIDYALFEKTSCAVVVPLAVAWSDLGSWDAIWKVGASDAQGNVCRGPVTLFETRQSLVVSETLHVAVDGLEDVAVIVSEDAVMVTRLSAAQRVGDVVKKLRAEPATRDLTEIHKTSYRPWGGYSSVVSGDRFQVKRLFVKPGRQLSLQRHLHRSEHWVVVRGTAAVTIGDKVVTMSENESVYIPCGEVHRLANPGKILLELIEVQTGGYLGEDDIIRLDDEFGRS